MHSRCSLALALGSTLFLGPLALAGSRATPAPSAPRSREGEEFFESRIRPLLAAQCFACHGPRAQQGSLRLDSRAALLKGGDSGPALRLDDLSASPLLTAVHYQGRLRMPPAGKLKPEQIDALESWVRMGAPWPTPVRNPQFPVPSKPSNASRASGSRPGTRNLEPTARHWAFLPVRLPRVPVVKNRSWVKTPIDAFVLARLEKAGLRPSPTANRRTLIRRAYLDLLGLPPTFAETEAFLSDRSPEAWEKVVDRLLASPHYGERWGRYWLDVARYSDTKGYVFFQEGRFPWSYTYRDYVVQSLNDDKPYDRFVLEQLAADQLDLGEDRRALAGMGFLTLGGRFMNNEQDIIDDRIDVVTRGILGLTVGCARCHDHKYDPIPTKDYYSLHAVFARGVEPIVPPLIQPEPQTEEYRQFARELAERERKLREFVDGKYTDLIRGARVRAGDYMLAVHNTRDHPATDDFMLLADGPDLNPKMLLRWQAFLERTRRPHHPVFAPWHALGELPEKEFAAKAPGVMARLAEAKDPARKVNPLVVRALTAKPPQTMAEVAQRYGELFQQVEARCQPPAPAGTPPVPPINSAPLPEAEWEELRQVLYAPGTPPMVAMNPIGDLPLLPDRPSQAKLQELLKAVETFRAAGPHAPSRAMVLIDSPVPLLSRVFVRGNPNNLGEEAPPRLPAILAGTQRQPFRQGSGRLELARALASPQNPLTARVMVNRVWEGHFGAGLVTTPSDFGVRSDPPSHPELLDYLAATFSSPAAGTGPATVTGAQEGQGAGRKGERDPTLLARTSWREDLTPPAPLSDAERGESPRPVQTRGAASSKYALSTTQHTAPATRQTSSPSTSGLGWSIKKLHKLILMSSTYQQSSRERAEAKRVDPENRLVWRMNRRRLDWEGTRDSLLAAAGMLDRTLGGPSVDLFAAPFSGRRTLYGTIDRLNLPGVLRTFDFPSPDTTSPRRDETTVPQQALFMLNHPFLAECAKRVLQRAEISAASDPAARVSMVYQVVLGRAPSVREQGLALEYLGANPQPAAWERYVQALLISNELVFVD